MSVYKQIKFSILCISILAGGSPLCFGSPIEKAKGQFRLRADILVDGKVVSSPQLIVLSDEPAEVNQGNPQSALRMRVTASDFASAEFANGIDLKMTVEYSTKDRVLRANPHVVVAPGEEGTFTLASGANDDLQMKIKAERL